MAGTAFFFKIAVEKAETAAIRQALNIVGGDRSKPAKILGVRTAHFV